LIVGVSENFVMPGLRGRTGQIYDVITEYAATVVFLCIVVAAVRRRAESHYPAGNSSPLSHRRRETWG
jgi:hypothetical protein